jgi:hypothetical protein
MQQETKLASGKIAVLAALMLGLSAGAGFAPTDDTNFYSDPVLPDPPLTVAHAYPASEATADVAAVSPAANLATQTGTDRPRNAKAQAHGTVCTALNPCAAVSPASRS